MPLTVSVFEAELHLTCKRNGEIEVVGDGKREDALGLAKALLNNNLYKTNVVCYVLCSGER